MIRVAPPDRTTSCQFSPPTRPLSSASAFHFGNLLCSFRSSRARSTKISHLYSTTCPLFFTLAKISPSFTHSSQKHPGGTPSLSQLLKLYLKFSTPSSLFTSHHSPIPNLALVRAALHPNHRPATTARTKEHPWPPQPPHLPPPPSIGARNGMNSTTQPT